MKTSQQVLVVVSILCAPLAARAKPCAQVTCPGEVGKEGGSHLPAGGSAPACPPQDGPDCPHSCKAANEGTCPASTQVAYLTIDNASKTDPRATCDSHGKCKVKLIGDLFVPAGAKKAPTILYSHGSVSNSDPKSTHTPSPPCAIANYFVSKGYAFFMPHRRGYGPSTGTLGSVEVDDQDIIDAFKFLKDHQSAAVNIEKVALMGHSLGGMSSIFANTNDFGQVVTVSIAGGSESWCGNTTLQGKLKDAVMHAKTPIYFFEPKDDVDTGPTIELSHTMGEAGDRYQAAIFGPVANDPALTPIKCGSQAHVCFTSDTYQVSRWAPSVLEYLQRFDVK